MVPQIGKKQKRPLAYSECPGSAVSQLCDSTIESRSFLLDQEPAFVCEASPSSSELSRTRFGEHQSQLLCFEYLV